VGFCLYFSCYKLDASDGLVNVGSVNHAMGYGAHSLPARRADFDSLSAQSLDEIGGGDSEWKLKHHHVGLDPVGVNGYGWNMGQALRQPAGVGVVLGQALDHMV
jgi:hypothetical protein